MRFAAFWLLAMTATYLTRELSGAVILKTNNATKQQDGNVNVVTNTKILSENSKIVGKNETVSDVIHAAPQISAIINLLKAIKQSINEQGLVGSAIDSAQSQIPTGSNNNNTNTVSSIGNVALLISDMLDGMIDRFTGDVASAVEVYVVDVVGVEGVPAHSKDVHT